MFSPVSTTGNKVHKETMWPSTNRQIHKIPFLCSLYRYLVDNPIERWLEGVLERELAPACHQTYTTMFRSLLQMYELLQT